MRPVYQTKFNPGNCHAAALASILEVPIDDIPDFGFDDDWYNKFSEYMQKTYGIQPLDIIADGNVIDIFIPQGYHIINGTSPRGHLHSVVGHKGEMVFDPYPNGGGLIKIESYTIFAVLDPKESKREGIQSSM